MGSYPWHVHCSSANHARKNRLARDAFTSPVAQPKRVLETDPEKSIFQPCSITIRAQSGGKEQEEFYE